MIEGETTVQLGKTYRDKITEFQGIATMRIEYLGGRIEWVLEGPAGEGRNKVEGDRFEAFRLELVADARDLDLTYPHEHAEGQAVRGAHATV